MQVISPVFPNQNYTHIFNYATMNITGPHPSALTTLCCGQFSSLDPSRSWGMASHAYEIYKAAKSSAIKEEFIMRNGESWLVIKINWASFHSWSQKATRVSIHQQNYPSNQIKILALVNFLQTWWRHCDRPRLLSSFILLPDSVRVMEDIHWTTNPYWELYPSRLTQHPHVLSTF